MDTEYPMSNPIETGLTKKIDITDASEKGPKRFNN
jgi:hypothetical protein